MARVNIVLTVPSSCGPDLSGRRKDDISCGGIFACITAHEKWEVSYYETKLD
ncbi:MAG: hypothetical protein IBX36_02555 [Dehalococcoidia bacterium]|nr:hypothetical protein [Dehalococcoidia bacterium]